MLPVQKPSSYQVLARKYRPTGFSDLQGQGALVQVLTNALIRDRIPHALLLTGIRGIGKTTIARIIARALNCTGINDQAQESIDPCGVCPSCKAISEGNQLDILEMDAASRSSIENIRPLLENAAYKPVNLRYKVFIIDEIHMLSKQAFNALLKTLEEPPTHLKFIFATTEIQRLPDTVISRCMRFDLNPFSPEELIKLIQKICQKEQVSVEEDAAALMAHAGAGSARDTLSLLERAILLGDKHINLSTIRNMLGLAEKDEFIELLRLISHGDSAKIIDLYHSLTRKGVDPVQLLKELHLSLYKMTLIKIGHTFSEDVTFNIAQHKHLQELCKNITSPTLMRLWHSLNKGINELGCTYSPHQAALMVLLRLCYLSDLPDTHSIINALQYHSPSAPDSLIAPSQEVQKGDKNLINLSRETQNKSSALKNLELPTLTEESRAHHESSQTLKVIKMPNLYSVNDLVDLCVQHREPLLRCKIEQDIVVHEINVSTLTLTLSLLPQAQTGLTNQLKAFLLAATGHEWRLIERENGINKSCFREEKKSHQEHLRQEATLDLNVQQILKTFPGSTIKEIKQA